MADKTQLLNGCVLVRKVPGILQRLAFAFIGIVAFATAAHAQSGELSCSLGKITEHVSPQYPLSLAGRITEGSVSLLATFAPDGHVANTRFLGGQPAFKFDAQAYVNGWRVNPNPSSRQCILQLDYRFDGSQAVCNKRIEVHIRAEHLDDAHVLLHLNCDLW